MDISPIVWSAQSDGNQQEGGLENTSKKWRKKGKHGRREQSEKAE